MVTKQAIEEALDKLSKQGNQVDAGGALKDVLLGLIDQAVAIETTDITALTSEQLDSLDCGDKVVKVTGKQKHLYNVSYKGDGVGEGLCLTYADASVIETVSYDLKATGWEYNSTDKWEKA